jgi:1-deoxy-D-xylulose-5-phosphate synthase
MAGPAVEAARILASNGFSASVIDVRFVKPLDSELILEAASGGGPLFVIEENAVSGGLGDAVSRLFSRERIQLPVTRIGIEDLFVPHGTRDELLAEQGLSAAKIAETVLSSFPGRGQDNDGGSR